MKIIISDVVVGLKLEDENNCEHCITKDISSFTVLFSSAHGKGSVCIGCFNETYSGVYVTCIDNDGYPI